MIDILQTAGRRYLKGILTICLMILLVTPVSSYGDDVTNTLHNLSITGPGTVKSTVEEEICIFCHTPHKASLDQPPLWNRSLAGDIYTTYGSGGTTYQSISIKASVGQPTGSAKLCLSCHDGTIALGSVLSRGSDITMAGGVTTMPAGRTLLATDLTDDHPVSFVLDGTLIGQNSELKMPAADDEVKLDGNSMVQCTSCHNPHSPNDLFLVKTRQNSDLCRTCHDKAGWDTPTSHKIATNTVNWNIGTAASPNPPFTGQSVAINACESCHDPHSSGSDQRILNFMVEEDNCFACHDGNTANTDIEDVFNNSTYYHPIGDNVGVHGPREDLADMDINDHVECMDCHNPHYANNSASPGAPFASGRNQGVRGINTTGLEVAVATNLYEICYKCHGDNNVKNMAPVNRVFNQINVRLEFDPGNNGYHPVEAIGKNPNVPSLRSPLTESSMIFCTDCHNNSDGRQTDIVSGGSPGSEPAGPHGSDNHFLLERQYDHQDNRRWDNGQPWYDMCMKCHSESNLLNNNSYLHETHLADSGVETACFTCHDPHGVSATQAGSQDNTGHHLIHFNTDIVSGIGSGNPPLYRHEATNFRGGCRIRCHGERHPDSGSGFRRYNQDRCVNC